MRKKRLKRALALFVCGLLSVQLITYAGEIDLIDELYIEDDSDDYLEDESLLSENEDIVDLDFEEENELLEDFNEDISEDGFEYSADEIVIEDNVDEELSPVFAEESEVYFESGYVLVKQGTSVFESASEESSTGYFEEDGVAYAVVADFNEDMDYSWLWITFDTEEANLAGDPLLSGYVQFKDVIVMSDETIEDMVGRLSSDESVRDYETFLLPLSFYVPNEEAGDSELLEQDLEAASVSQTIAITEQPADIVTGAGTSVTLHVGAEGNGLSYQWQYKVPTGSRFVNASSAGAKKADWTFTASQSLNGRLYQCVITDENGNSATTDQVSLTIAAGPVITEQPVNIVTAAGKSAALHVGAEGNGLTYQWQYKNPTGSRFVNATSAGAKTADWTFTASQSLNGRLYQCVITDENGISVTSDQVSLTIAAGPEITEQPVDIVTAAGKSATLHVAAEGNGLTYQWQYKNPTGSKFVNAASAGAKTADWTFTASQSLNGRLYQCVITDENGSSVTSDRVSLTIAAGPEITEQPVDIVTEAGNNVTLHVGASGDGLSYQWQYKNPTGSKFVNAASAGAKKADWTFTATQSLNGRKYQCIVTDENGISVTSDAALLTVQIVADDVVYETLTNTTLTVADYLGSASSLVIPEIVQGMTVTEIGEGAFEGNQTLVEIDLPDTITVIGKRAFKNCSNLSSMY